MRITLLFIVTIILGAALRFWWIAYDLPYAFNIDEAYIMDGAVDVADGNLRHGVIFRGSLPYYVTGLTIRLASMVYSTIKQGFPTFREAYAYDKTPFYIVGRAIVASYSMLTMIVLFLIARALFSETIGLLTILIFSLNTLEIQYAHQIYSDTALSFFMLLTLYTLVIAYKHKRQSLFLVSAVIIGLAMGQKLPGVVLLPFALLVYRASLINQHISRRSQIIRCLAIVGIVILVYFLSYPFIFSELSSIGYKWNEDTRANLDQLIILETGYLDKIRDYIIWLRTGSGTIVFLATFIGACQVLKKRAFFTNLFMGFTLCFLLFIALAKAHWDNYILPILPITSLFAAVVLYTLYQGAVAYSHTKLFGLFLVGLLLYPATTKAVWIARSYSRPDTRSQEIQWFKDHHIESNRIARDGHTSIDVPSDTVLLSKLTHDQLKNFDYIVLSGWYSPNFANPKRNTPGLAQWYADLKRTYTKVAEFMPSDDMIFRDDIQVATIWNWWKQPPPVRGPQISIYAININ